MRPSIARSQVRISEVDEFLLIRGSLPIFVIELYRAAFSRFLAKTASPVSDFPADLKFFLLIQFLEVGLIL